MIAALLYSFLVSWWQPSPVAAAQIYQSEACDPSENHLTHSTFTITSGQLAPKDPFLAFSVGTLFPVSGKFECESTTSETGATFIICVDHALDRKANP